MIINVVILLEAYILNTTTRGSHCPRPRHQTTTICLIREQPQTRQPNKNNKTKKRKEKT